MFLVIRLLFILLVLGFGWTGYKYLKTRDAGWLRLMRWLLNIVIAILLVFFVGLFAERIFWN
ncbi:MAG: hypothetical protein P4L87_10285 [Formivibrio sp.]|nr:hypothetical protein [Formivibrio sp.]